MKSVLASLLLLPAVAAGAPADSGVQPDERRAAGKQLAMARNKGNCLACHAFDDGELPAIRTRECRPLAGTEF